MDTALMAKIAAIPLGKSFGTRGPDTYAFIVHRPEGLVVECGWTVPETDSDDPESYSYNPFKGRTATPAWIGRRQVCTSAPEAAAVYTAYKEAVSRSRVVEGGETIGSVCR